MLGMYERMCEWYSWLLGEKVEGGRERHRQRTSTARLTKTVDASIGGSYARRDMPSMSSTPLDLARSKEMAKRVRPFCRCRFATSFPTLPLLAVLEGALRDDVASKLPFDAADHCILVGIERSIQRSESSHSQIDAPG